MAFRVISVIIVQLNKAAILSAGAVSELNLKIVFYELIYALYSQIKQPNYLAEKIG